MSPRGRHGRPQAVLNCAQLRSLIPLQVGGDQAPGYERAFATHLRVCLPCGARVQAYADQQALLRSYGRVGDAVSLDLWGPLRTRLSRPSWERRWPRDVTGG